MTRQSFSLIPFSIQDAPDLTIKGEAARRNNTLYIRFVLAGNLEEVTVPELSANPARKHQLWRTTCFEFFIAIKSMPQYWEFNMSPSGDWNIYVMDAYRQVGMREETRIQRIPFEVQKAADGLSLEIANNLGPIIAREKPIEVGITCVIQTKSGKETYWAVLHPRPEADFHAREGFVLKF
ncbi:MAG: DOMON-like domain-containing protein [Anaerolineales bacterium]